MSAGLFSTCTCNGSRRSAWWSAASSFSEDGKALKFYDVAHFDVHLTAATVAAAAQTLTTLDP